jgi:signal transduction histidine kinase
MANQLADLERVDAPLTVCSTSGHAVAATLRGRELLERIAGLSHIPAPLPPPLWAALAGVPPGRAVEWRPPGGAHMVLGCTRYRAGDGYLLLMNEITDKRAELSRRLHQQRLEATGRLVASIAHELRNSVASIVYSADFLGLAVTDLPRETIRDTAREMLAASRRLEFTVDGLLDYAKLGPTVAVPVSLREVLTRAQGFLRSVFRRDAHRLRTEIDPAADWVRGNSLTIEQIFINLLLNAAEASTGTVTVVVTSKLVDDGSTKPGLVRVTISDDGHGVPAALRESIFEPFFTTRENATGLGLTTARDAAASLGGDVTLEDAEVGARFVVTLQRGDRP